MNAAAPGRNTKAGAAASSLAFTGLLSAEAVAEAVEVAAASLAARAAAAFAGLNGGIGGKAYGEAFFAGTGDAWADAVPLLSEVAGVRFGETWVDAGVWFADPLEEGCMALDPFIDDFRAMRSCRFASSFARIEARSSGIGLLSCRTMDRRKRRSTRSKLA